MVDSPSLRSFLLTSSLCVFPAPPFWGSWDSEDTNTDIKQAPLLAFVLMSGQKKKRKHTYELGQSEVPFYSAKRHSWDFREHQKKKKKKNIQTNQSYDDLYVCLKMQWSERIAVSITTPSWCTHFFLLSFSRSHKFCFRFDLFRWILAEYFTVR